MQAGTVFTSIAIISTYLQSTIQDQAAEVRNFYGNISLCVLEEKLDFLKEIVQGTYNIV